MIIGLTGNMGVGKSTASELIKEAFFNRNFKTVKFAGPLYDMQEYIYRRISAVYTRPDHFTKDRTLLQWLGTEWGRNTITKSLWIDLWKEDTRRFLAAHTNGIVVCDDVRFDNEAETVRNLGGFVIKVKSKSADERINTGSGIAKHASEDGIKEEFINATVNNNGTLRDFEQDLLKAIKSFGVRSDSKVSGPYFIQ